jgi:hypothetical protein
LQVLNWIQAAEEIVALLPDGKAIGHYGAGIRGPIELPQLVIRIEFYKKPPSFAATDSVPSLL